MLESIFIYCIIPLLAILTFYIVSLIRAKVQDINKTHDNDLVAKYTYMLGETVSNCVIATTQTYVDSLKK